MYKVLVVEDEYYIRKGIISLLDYERLNCTIVAEAENGQEALEILRNQQVDIVITDIRMPIMTGIELLENTKELETVFIILSGYNEFDFAQKALNLGASSYILKPIEKDNLESVIEKAKEDLRIRKLSHKVTVDQEHINKIDLLKHLEFRKKDDVVEAMIDYVRLNYKNKFTMQTLSEEINYSESTLNNRFRNIMGSSFNTFVNHYRIQKAINLLESGADPADVYSQVGYSEYKYFSHVFKKYVNISPSTFKSMIEK